MKVIRCKDCVHNKTLECPLSGVKRSPLFFCGKAKPSEDYKPSCGDNIRNMTDKEIANVINGYEHDAYLTGKNGGVMKFGKENIDFWTGYLKHPEGEDF